MNASVAPAIQDDKQLLVVGQTPPPTHGQAIMIQYLLDGAYRGIQLQHVRMNFSRDTESVGKFQVAKLLALFPLILKILYWRARGYRSLYYPPASGKIVPILRDMIVLGCTRFFFKTIFHFHAADLTQAYDRLPRLLKPFYRFVYGRPDLAILVADKTGIDLDLLRPRRAVIVPNAVADQGMVSREMRDSARPGILYVGSLCRGKGLLELLDMTRLLLNKQLDFHVDIVGEFTDQAFETEFRDKLLENQLTSNVTLHGRVTCSVRKKELYGQADLFCFPTYYSAETFGIVLIEAMSSGLPVVSTFWRSIPDTVQNGETGLLVPPQDAESLARRVEQLLVDRELRLKMGRRGRQRFTENFTLDLYHQRLEREFHRVCM